jgi:nicotinate phosphoribosyltransferase
MARSCYESPADNGYPRLLQAKEQDTLWDETRRLVNPHKVYVDLSRELYDTEDRSA